MKLRTFVATSIVAVASGMTSAAPVPTLNIASLIERSNIVAIGRVLSVATGEPSIVMVNGQHVPGRTVTVRLSIDSYLKGIEEDDVLQCSFPAPDGSYGYGVVHADDYRMFFLSAGKVNCSFADPYYLSLPAVPLTNVPGADPVERVSFALVAVLDSPAVSASDKRSIILDADTLPTPQIKSALRRASKDSDLPLSLSASAALLLQNDLFGLPAIEKALLEEDRGLPTGTLTTARGYLAKVTNSAAIPSLTRLLSAENPLTRRSAVSALRNTSSPLALRALAGALDDSDGDVQYIAVMALAELNKDYAHASSIDKFRESPGHYIQFWKAWATQRGLSR